jgi:cytochrome c553
MKRVLLAIALCVPLFAAAQDATPKVTVDPFTHGDATAGGSKAPVCYACHGPGGNGAINPEWPKLGGQGAAYIAEQLAAFKCGPLPADQQTAATCPEVRNNAVMSAQAGALAPADMADLAAYFASQKFTPGVASKDAIAVAEPLYRYGDASRELPACAACHGPTGAGNVAAKFPHIGGQNSGYTANQLRNYQSGARGKSGPGVMMAGVAQKLKPEEIEALAAYVSGLQ